MAEKGRALKLQRSPVRNFIFEGGFRERPKATTESAYIENSGREEKGERKEERLRSSAGSHNSSINLPAMCEFAALRRMLFPPRGSSVPARCVVYVPAGKRRTHF